MSTHLVKSTASMLRECAERCQELALTAASPEQARELRRLARRFKAEITRLTRRDGKARMHRARPSRAA